MGENNNILSIVAIIVTIINSLGVLYMAIKKFKPEVKKIETETDLNLAAAAEGSLRGAEISNNMLIGRINELKQELEHEKDSRKQELDQERSARQADGDYFRRRIRDLERENRDYRNHIAKLIKQVIGFGGVPEPFTPSPLDESDPTISRVPPGAKKEK